jgi:cold shock CspA family protein
MKQNKNILLYGIIGFIVLLIVINSIVIGNYLLRRGGGLSCIGSGNLSPHILDITGPIMSVQGKVLKITNSTITVEPVAAGMAVTPASDKKTPQITIQLKDDTSVTRGPNPAVSGVEEKLSKENLAEGQIVTVSVASDLRLSGTPEAVSIMIAPEPTSLSGVIESVSGSGIVVKGSLISTAPVMTAVEPQTFTVTAGSATEVISIDVSTSTTASSQRTVSLQSLEKGQSVTVFFENKPEGNKVTATRIQAFSMPEVSTASGSAQPGITSFPLSDPPVSQPAQN